MFIVKYYCNCQPSHLDHKIIIIPGVLVLHHIIITGVVHDVLHLHDVHTACSSRRGVHGVWTAARVHPGGHQIITAMMMIKKIEMMMVVMIKMTLKIMTLSIPVRMGNILQ